ncbi:30S ribosomal protein S4 [Candidatus Shapirobacteria bacterium CG08_land_8_20_14_0_20_39_18]|uniref:Small ribosomal subunit protein uS4 n=1 Tax=Candidatus Shapirobacteria bacterium CG08_land_8_20_14_0_20_39_18 TaxID=1974883 RepID=A0A2M6XEC0_9BACT|nr:MAG: 30S ribosomal protein S4 [Candidatus Shapirobacteria bacterium CG08_land_8_20_14_0_20_39_18]PIY66428.1 MAG: 30S ribosomal protein S4 [Candidatus Shapirobacteria bacterium CG_4_10_14_0_8_um_filter_39_15]PJE68400.1 MAG: 30S ribosomal protein S4 [Candidatus Shapirobacteria bacterium CG10_big_fil_rev_8_21_14_0_10_38_8]
MKGLGNNKCRLCRREKSKLFLKGARCLSPKCPIDKKGAVTPGVNSQRRKRNPSEYGIQLREKQKVKRTYGVMENQFKRYFALARKTKGATGEALLKILEMRLDNVVYRLGFTPSRTMARQLVSHRHVYVNGKKVNIASYEVKPGDVINLSTKALVNPTLKKTLTEKNDIMPEWLIRKAAVGKVERLPRRDEIGDQVDEQLVVEYYSR